MADCYSDSDVEFLASICLANTRRLQPLEVAAEVIPANGQDETIAAPALTESQTTELMLRMLDDPAPAAAPENLPLSSSSSVQERTILPSPGKYTPAWMLDEQGASSLAAAPAESEPVLSDTQRLQQMLEEEDANLAEFRPAPKAPPKDLAMPKGVIWCKMLSAAAAAAPEAILLDRLHDQITRPALYIYI